MSTPYLKYQFVCHYEDGDKLLQDSGKPNEKHFGHIDHDRLERFELVGQGRSYSVDVKTGEFNLNGVKISFKELPQQADYRLIYFRRVQQFWGGMTGYRQKYCFGLQCTYEGKNHQVLVWIDENTGTLEIGGEK